ncbi:MAG TPA: sigma-70 family RNA polymerase sigma factor [Pirellulales bacterium]|nr:sigma-70 family RNA polymerase sigma factor [Pirellulales bacterium]
MSSEAGKIDALIERAARGDEQALGELFSRYRERMKQMVKLRLDRRLAGRVDPSDVVQDAFVEASKRLPDFARKKELPLLLWLRLVTGEKLIDLHRTHLGTKMRDAGLEVSLYRGALPEASSVMLASQLLGQLTTPSQAVVRAEVRLQVQTALNSLGPLDREVLALRHFEQLNNEETALVLGIRKSAASHRYVRAVVRLKEILSAIPGFSENL